MSPRPTSNGLRSFAIHSQEQPDTMRAIEGAASIGAGVAAGGHEFAGLDAETAARHYIKTALQSPDVPAFAAAGVTGDREEFRNLGTEAQPLTGTQTVKFRQMHRRIPVYGSLVTVELDEANNLISINSGLGEPTDVSPIATVSPARAAEVVQQAAGYGNTPLDATPRLFYFYDGKGSRWRLVYVIEDVAKPERPAAAGANAPPAGGIATAGLTRMPEYSDYVIDANTADLVAELARTHNADSSGVDGLDAERDFEVIPVPGISGANRMHDQTLNIRTHDFKFQNLNSPAIESLPGPFVDNPPDPWSPAAVSAHCNAAAVGRFLKDVLMRNGLDNLGSPITSSVNCVASFGTQEWRNAAWIGALNQMVYGQRSLGNGKFRSYAVALDVVAHEVLHGLTDNTARLVYEAESGALNESYSDIFGIIVANLGQPDIGQWDWRLGEDISLTGIPLRDLRDPTLHGQPDHMDNYQDLPLEEDHGGVHTNSGIHNKAAFNLLTTKKADGSGFLFTGQEVAAIFYLTLSQHLAATSGFSDSRRGADLATKSLFRNATDKAARVQALAAAFDKVGIV